MMTTPDLEALVKFNTYKNFTGHEFLLVVFTFQSSRNINKGDTSDLLNSEHLIIAIAQLCNKLQVCNFTML